MEISVNIFSIIKVLTIIFLIYITYIYTRKGCPVGLDYTNKKHSNFSKQIESGENLDDMISYYMKLQDEALDSSSE